MDLRWALSRQVWAMNVVLVAVTAWLWAGMANRRLAEAMPGPATAAQAPPARTAAASHGPSPEAIVNRDLFNVHNLDPAAPAPAAPIFIAAALGLKLLGIAFFSPGHPANVATVLDSAARKTGLFKKGDAVAPDAVVDEVRMDRLVLARKDGGREELLFDNNGRATAAPRPARPSPVILADPPSSYVPPQDDDDGAITRIGLNSYQVGKNYLDRVSSRPDIITEARVTPEYEGEGETRSVVGFRISRIQSGSLFEKIGLHNGDVLKSINGNPLNSMESALGLLQSLRRETSFRLEIERGHAPVVLRYQVE